MGTKSRVTSNGAVRQAPLLVVSANVKCEKGVDGAVQIHVPLHQTTHPRAP